jgi:hypothetical protein
MLILNTGAPQWLVLSSLLYSLFTHDCVAKHNSNTIVKSLTLRQPIGTKGADHGLQEKEGRTRPHSHQWGVYSTNKLSWTKHTKTAMKRARQLLFQLRRLKRFGLSPQILKVLQLHQRASYRECPDRLHPTPGMATARHPNVRCYRR